MTAYWDGETPLPSSWYLTQTKQWKQFRYWFWNEFIAPQVCCDGLVVECAYCKWKGPRTKDTYFCLDHVVPYIEAPERWNDLSNISIACNHCNKKKGNKSLKEFVTELLNETIKTKLC
jgi:5-methylcytosine-specific restriction endonuclease McrA